LLESPKGEHHDVSGVDDVVAPSVPSPALPVIVPVAVAIVDAAVKKSKVKKVNGKKGAKAATSPTTASTEPFVPPPSNFIVKNTNWVMCNHTDCGKWRKIPSNVDVDNLPEQWYCTDNVWDSLHNCCDADEEQ